MTGKKIRLKLKLRNIYIGERKRINLSEKLKIKNDKFRREIEKEREGRRYSLNLVNRTEPGPSFQL
jgi:hypothetical protein